VRFARPLGIPRALRRQTRRPAPMARNALAAPALGACVAAAVVALGVSGARAFGLAAGAKASQRERAAQSATRPDGGAGRAGAVLEGSPGGPAAGFWAGAMGVVAGLGVAASSRGLWRRSEARRTSLRYTTQQILPSLSWIKTGFKSNELQNGELRAVCLAGCDICVGKTATGKLFAVGDKAPPTGLSFSVGGEVEGDTIVEPQYGCTFDIANGQPVGTWCPSPPIVGGVIGAIMGGPMAVSVFDVRQDFFSGDIQVLTDVNAKKAYEADYWKGLLDAQGKDDGSYY